MAKQVSIEVSEEFAAGFNSWSLDQSVPPNPHDLKEQLNEYRRFNSGWYAARCENLNNRKEAEAA